MLQVDLNHSDQQVERSIRDSCAQFGRVTSVESHGLPTPYALIEMSRGDDIYELAARLGGSAFGDVALVHLEQKASDNSTDNQARFQQ